MILTIILCNNCCIFLKTSIATLLRLALVYSSYSRCYIAFIRIDCFITEVQKVHRHTRGILDLFLRYIVAMKLIQNHFSNLCWGKLWCCPLAWKSNQIVTISCRTQCWRRGPQSSDKPGRGWCNQLKHRRLVMCFTNLNKINFGLWLSFFLKTRSSP